MSRGPSATAEFLAFMGALKTRDWKTRERIGYGKPFNSKQQTHFQMLLQDG